MTTDLETYSNELLLALRMRDVPGPRIAEALAEVHSHVAETGEDPEQAFGPPRAYADELVAALGGPAHATPFWRGLLSWSSAAYGVSGALGAWLLLDGVIRLSTGERGPLGLPAVASLVLGALVLVALVTALIRLTDRSDSEVLDPRTGADMTPPLPRWVIPVAVTPPILGLVLAAAVALAQR